VHLALRGQLGILAERRRHGVAKPSLIRLRLELQGLEELFSESGFDPLGGRAEELPGLERLLDELRPLPRGVPLHTTLVLPARERAPDLEARCRAALRDVLDRRLVRNRNDARSVRQEGYATLWRGLAFLALCLAGSSLMAVVDFAPGFIERFIDEGLVIAGWVALWYPLDVLLYQRWPLARERCLYETVRDMALDFEFRD
jgi:hypothetical protein